MIEGLPGKNRTIAQILESRLAALIPAWAVFLLPLAFWPPFEDAFKLPQFAVVTLALACAIGVGAFRASSVIPWAVPALVLAGGHLVSAAIGGSGRFADASWFVALPVLALASAGARGEQSSPCASSAGAKRLVPFLLVAAGALTSAYSIAQFAGFDPAAPWHTGGARPFSTMGNPDFLAAYLVAVLPLAVLGWLRRPTVLRGAAGLLIAAAILLSQSRGAWLGVAAAVAAYPFVMRAAGRPVRPNRAAGLGLVAALLLAAGFFLLHGPARERLANIGNVRHFDAAGRLAMWKAAADMIPVRPLFGGGPGSFGARYPARHAALMRADPALPYFYTENAHSDWLQLPAEEGILVFGLWLWVWAVFVRTGVRAIKGGDRDAPGLLLGFLAIQVNAFFNFPWYLIPVHGWFWFALVRMTPEIRPSSAPRRRYGPMAAGLVVILLVGVMLGRMMTADGWLKLSGDFLASARWQEALYCSGRAESRWIFWENGQRVAANASRAAYQLGDLAGAEKFVRRVLAGSPDSPADLSQLALVLAREGRLAEARTAGRQALALNPRQADSWHVLGNVAFLAGDRAEARRCWTRALDENPSLTGARDSLAALSSMPAQRRK
jgi:tetratricopeptide (TPR) repeat protein